MSVISSGSVDTEPQVSTRSVRFRSGQPTYSMRTFANTGTATTWTYSAWVKLSSSGSTRMQLFAGGTSTAGHAIEITTNGQLSMYQWGAGPATVLVTTAFVLRDPTGWYHLVVSCDTTEVTASDRIKMYVNGVQVTSFASTTYPPQNVATYINDAYDHHIGTRGDLAFPFNGHISDVRLIDGQALNPTAFGTFHSDTGEWIQQPYAGVYGDTGFHLSFSAGSSLSELFEDASGNGNNWSGIGVSLTPGITYDWMLDCPVNNFPTLNPVDVTTGTIGAGGLSNAGTAASARPSMTLPTTGKWYVEFMQTSIGSQIRRVGVHDATGSGNVAYRTDGQREINGAPSIYGSTWGENVVVGVAADMDANQVTFYRAGVSQGSISVAINTYDNPIFFGSAAGTPGTDGGYVNFGQQPFQHDIPVGFKPLCAQTLPIPSVRNGRCHFDTRLIVGQSTPQSVTGLLFQPSLLLTTARTATTGTSVIDAVRGGDAFLLTNSTIAELTFDGITFEPDGIGNLTGSDGFPYVLHMLAGGEADNNTDGTITSAVNTNAVGGFSIVTYTGTGSAGTIGHGLGVAPSLIIVKGRTTGSQNWPVWHHKLSNATQYLLLNTTNAVQTNAQLWNSTLPTTTVFSVGSGSAATNNPSDTYVAYCFAEVPGFSRMGAYVNTPSTDGPYVYCGFKPAFILIKHITSGSTDWMAFDTVRDSTNVVSPYTRYNIGAVEGSKDWLDVTSFGFKIRNTDSSSATINLPTGAGTFVFLAFAEVPSKYANAK